MSKHSHRHKKFNRYTRATASRKKNIFKPYLFIILSAVLAFVLAMILGNCLGELAETAPNESQSNPPDKNNDPTLLNAQQINGVFVTLEGITDNTEQNVRAQITSDTTAASLCLFDENGNPYYSSAVAAAFDKPTGELTLKYVFDALENSKGSIYSSVLFPSSALSNTETEKQAVLNAYESSLVAELADAGACDIVISTFELGNDSFMIDELFTERLAEYVSTLRRAAPELRIGFTLSLSHVESSECATAVEDISKIVDFLALDLTEKSSPEALTAAIDIASISILRREMRLLIYAENEKALLSLTDILSKYSMTNWQVAK